MVDRIIGALYIVLGIGLVVTVVFGDGAPLSIDWTLSWIDLIATAVWVQAPFIVAPALIFLGFCLGYAEKGREVDHAEQMRRNFGELWKRVVEKRPK